ncbi:hypothetical protein CBR_g33986 [Chara braunii]|uniref:ABC transporter domain-containing protein n=1 Tax=Chara braunii TaxID=69332 RepID=A0A388LHK9_CHABU|nr:hypothetical protein CBR_g33986 [Chara braunii]|eukprot:GBG81806.1 hypothetical protein CBR_g33986 [Chara braunii]
MTGLPGQLANETIAAYKQRCLAQIEAEEQRLLAVEAARVQAEEAAAAEKLRLQADADADSQARRKEAQDLLQRHEATSIDRLKFWLFEPNGDEATPEEQHKEFLSKLVTRLLYACNYQRSELERQYQDVTQQHQELATIRRTVQSHEDATRALNARLLDLEQAVPGPTAGASSSAPSSRQLEEHVDHILAMLGDINTFAASSTISTQLHTLKTEVQQLQILPVAKHKYIGALFLNSKGGCQAWLTHLATSHGVDVPDLKDKITWKELTRLWKKRFIVDDAPALAINRLFTMSQGNTATRDWLTEWQKIAAVPNLNLPFEHLRREFYNRSCAALSQALGDREQYSTFAEIINKARELIKTNRPAAHEKSMWQPTYVEKVRTGPRQQQFATVQSDSGDNPAATPASSDGDQVAVVQPRSTKSRNNGKAKSASQAGNGQPGQFPWVKFGLTEAEYKVRGREATPPSTPPDSAALLAAYCTSGEDANVASPRYAYEDYVVHLVPPLDQPLHVQQSIACTVSSPSATDSAASPQSIVGDSTSWSRLEELDPLTFTDFQWMPVPSTGRLLKPHCSVLMAQLRDYLHTAVPAPLMDAGAEVVDLLAYIAKIDREFKTQRYDDIDAPLLYIRIQIGEATCSALIDCGASRNYISQDFMVRAGLGPRVQRKSQPTQVTLADGHTHKSIDRCIDAVPMYFAPHTSEAVSFDILDTKFYMILGMAWLRSKDHLVNFFNRTVHVRDQNGVLVSCTVPLPHPSISCHVVTAASMRASIIRDDIEEMGVPNPPEARLKPLDKQQLMSRWKLMAKRIGSQIQLKDKDQNRGLTNRSIKEKDANGGNGRNRTTDQGHGQAGTDVEQGRTLMISSSGLKFEPVTLSFHGLCYEIDIPGIRHPRILLNHVSGYAKPGTMTALMGSSGAGKTTLLDVLAGRKTIGRINGEILVNGYPVVQQTYARIRGYVEQNDIHTPFATVRESLEFSATLRLPRGTPAKIRRDYVKEVMDLLDLHPIANHLVGIRGDGGLSIEQAKRLTIAVELVANPSILFLDEPTSGLSSRAAQSVITGIQNIVATGRSVICTIHQPSRRLFLAFNQLLLMKTGGEVVYFGPLGHDGRDLLDYFESLPGIPKCRNDQNPASYMLEVVGAGIGHAAPRDFVQDYQRSELAQRNEETLTHLRHGKGKLGYNPTAKGYAASPGLMGLTIFKRMFRTYWRNVSYSVGRIMFHIGLGLLLGTTYVRIHGKMRVDLPTVLSMGGLIYIALVFIAMVNANNVIPQVNYERPVYYREQASNMYSTFLYNVSWGFAETATIIIPIVSNIWNIMSGFMIPKKSIPNFYIWLFWVNPTQYALNALTSIAFYCDVQKNPNCPKLKETDAYVWPTMKAARSLDYSRRYIDMLALLLFMAAFRALAYVALKFMKYNRR